MLEQGEVSENSGEGSFRYRLANRSFFLGMEAKDKSNHLTGDSLRTFPQDNWSSTVCFGIADD